VLLCTGLRAESLSLQVNAHASSGRPHPSAPWPRPRRWQSPARRHPVSCRACWLPLLGTGLRAEISFRGCVLAWLGRSAPQHSGPRRGNLWVAPPPRERTPGVARCATVPVSWPSSHECMPRTGPRPRGGTQSQRTLARARVATDAVAGGKAAPPRGRVVRLREAADPFPGSPGLVGQLGRKWHPGPLGSSVGPTHHLGLLSQIQRGPCWGVTRKIRITTLTRESS
jgi:hypothetical protein